MQNIIRPVVHNRFDIEVSDAKTGKIKRRVTSYNIILDRYFTRLIDRSSKIGYIHLGTGEGTPTVDRTSMFTFLGVKSATAVETVKAYPTSYTRRKIVLSPSDYVGSRITEVGFGYSTSSSSAVTHSMLKDSEGNQIAIDKTDTDVLTIYATFYLTIGGAVNGVYVLPSPDNNAIIAAVLEDSYSKLDLILGAHNTLANADELDTRTLSSKSSITPVADQTNRKWQIPTTRWNYSEANSHMVGSIGSPTMAAWLLPNANIFPQITLSNLVVGVGDGTMTEFACPIPKIVPNTESIRVNGVLLTKDVDYTIDYNNNSAEYPELFVNTDSNNCTITGGASSTYYPYYPFFVWGICRTGTNAINPSSPVIFDFGNDIVVNRIYMPAGSISFGGSGSPNTAIGFDYSDDGESWTNLHTTTAAAYNSISADIRLGTAISARYWRITSTYISTLGCGRCPNILLGYVTPGLTFTTPPASGDAIEMDCKIDRPLKNENWVLDFGFSVQFERG